MKYIWYYYEYINRENEIENIKKYTLNLKTKNCISREEIIQILKDNYKNNDKIYFLQSILKYNIDIEPNDISNYLKTNTSFFDTIKKVDIIPLKKSISMFHGLNSIYIIFYEKNANVKNTRRNKHMYNNKTNKNHLKNIL